MKRMKVKAFKKKSIWSNLKFVNPLFLALSALMLLGGIVCLYLYFTTGTSGTTTQSGGRNQFGFGARGLSSTLTMFIASLLTLAAGVTGVFSWTKRYRIPASVGFGAAAILFWASVLIGVIASGGFGSMNIFVCFAAPVVSVAYFLIALSRNSILPRKDQDSEVY